MGKSDTLEDTSKVIVGPGQLFKYCLFFVSFENSLFYIKGKRTVCVCEHTCGMCVRVCMCVCVLWAEWVLRCEQECPHTTPAPAQLPPAHLLGWYSCAYIT